MGTLLPVAHRTFTNLGGVEWEAWDVLPGATSRPREADRRRDRREDDTERRGRGAYWVGVRSDLAAGWLCFKSGNETRRLAPIPDGWELFSEEQLRDLLDSVAPRTAQSRSV